MKLTAAVLTLSLALAGPCAGAEPARERATGRQGADMTPLAHVQSWAGSDSTVVEWTEARHPGFQFFVVGKNQSSRLVVVEAGKWPPLEHEAALRALVERGAREPVQLARACLKIAEGAEELITVPGSGLDGIPPAEAVLARAPEISGGVLTFFFRSARNRALSRTQIQLAGGAVKTELAAQLVSTATGSDGALAEARKGLFSDSNALQQLAVDKLVSLASDPRAVALLTEAVQSHGSPFARGIAAAGLGRCKAVAAVPVLSVVLRKDKDAAVRKSAVEALGKIGDAAARPALTEASGDEDEEVKWAAARALKKLP